MVRNYLIDDSVYSNKTIPEKWKNKIDYKIDMLKMFSQDERLVAYLGKSVASDNNQASLKQFNKTTFSFPNLKRYASERSMVRMTEKIIDNNDNENQQLTSKIIKPKSGIPNKKQRDLSQNDIKNILEDYHQAYPLDKKEYDTMNRAATINMKSNSCRTINHITKKEMFKTTIFSKLLPQDEKNELKTAIKTKNEKKTGLGIFLNFDYEIYNKKREITHPIIKNELKSISNFGPYYSYCPSCNNKNVDFYQKMEPNQCIQLIKAIKRSRRRLSEMVSTSSPKTLKA